MGVGVDEVGSRASFLTGQKTMGLGAFQLLPTIARRHCSTFFPGELRSASVKMAL